MNESRLSSFTSGNGSGRIGMKVVFISHVEADKTVALARGGESRGDPMKQETLNATSGSSDDGGEV